MRDGKMRYLISFCFILGASGFSLFSSQTSYVEFERLPGKTDGEVSISFRCKTYVKFGLLFYVDDKAQSGDYLTLYLKNGFLLLELSDGTGNVFKANSKDVINDLRWHRIDIELSSHHAGFRIDNETQAEFNITNMQLKSDLYIGGFPNDIDIFSLSHDEMTFMARFLGCVTDVSFSTKVENLTDNSAKMLRWAGMDRECKDACKPTSPCKNRGVCINKFAMADCLCAGTGYRGKNCEEESPVVGFSSSNHRATFDVLSSSIAASSETTSISVRIRSSQPDGVFFNTAHDGDFILLELTNGRIAASVNLGSGSVTITTKKNAYNDDQWHRVKLERVKRLVNLTVDNLDTTKGKTQGAFYKFLFPDKKTSFILGGFTDYKKTKLKSVSKNNFTGCLQELIFNGYDLFDQFNKSAKEITSRGKFLNSCPKTPTKPPTISGPYNTSTSVAGTLKATKTSEVFSVTLTDQQSPCILLGIPCDGTTTRVPTSQTHVVTSSQVTSGERVYTYNQSKSSLKTLVQSTVGPTTGATETSPSNSENLSTDKNAQTATSRSSMTNGKVSQDNGMPRTTGEVIMASRNERREGDLTIYFILAAVVGLVAFLLAILIIVKVNWASKKKYAIRGKQCELDYWADTGSFQKSTKESKPLV